MATIEPRLIHLLNDSSTPELPHADLPSIHALHLPTSTDRSVSQADSDGPHRPEASSDPHGSTHTDAARLAGDQGLGHRRGERHREGHHYSGPTAVHPLQLLLTDSSLPGSPQVVNGYDESSEAWEDASSRKRNRPLPNKDDFVQLPQPVKKHKASGQALHAPPIIKPLLEPPPHAALFPPISSTTFADKGHRHQNPSQQAAADEYAAAAQNSPNASSPTDGAACKGRKRATKPRRKWSEQETKHLLLGVHRHGVGKWTSILDDSDFRFNERTAGDLKDRFRTCCPDELRRSKKASASKSAAESSKQTTHSPASDHASIQASGEDDKALDRGSAGRGEGSDMGSKPKKSRAHRKNLDDLAELGIHGPFKKSHRRERRPFTDEDDRQILEGLDQYGPAWTKIHRDPRFNLSSRQPTDLRDRVRNKYAEIYQRIEKGTFQPREGSRSNAAVEPSASTKADRYPERSKTVSLDSHSRHTSLNDDFSRGSMSTPEPSDATQASQGLELSDTIHPQLISGEMDISRLLLDDSKLTSHNLMR